MNLRPRRFLHQLALYVASAAFLALPSPQTAAQQAAVPAADSRDVWLIDEDKDGWDDLWCAVYLGMNHRDRTRDSDGDGLTDYEEMLRWSHPYIAGTPTLSPEEKALREKELAQAARAAEEAWQRTLVEAAPRLRALIPPGQSDPDEKIAADAAAAAALRQQAAISKSQAPAKERALDDLAAKHGVPKEMPDGKGGKLKLAGESLGPIFIGSHDTLSAAGISADEVWPVTAWPGPEVHTGLNLTGAGQTLGMWEVSGAARTTHIELGAPRVQQRDTATLDASGHATQVAGTIAAAGAGFVFNGQRSSRGVAFGANLFAYDMNADFAIERAAAAAGNVTDPAVRLSNHSWGFTCGWRLENFNPSGTPNNQWVWYGPQAATFQEDHKFGFYLSDQAPDTGSTQMDLFMQAQAPQHLMLYACGNDRTQGPGASPGTYYYRTGIATWTAVNATTFPRDWDDGDAGFFDTVAPPGTAKNVLTVGASEDVFRPAGGGGNLAGFGLNANAVPAFFSGAGPTDDGRIKPDLVAVGTTNFDFRNTLGMATAGTAATALLLAPTAVGDDQYTGGAIGTSFAAPAVTGGLGLILERRAQLFPGVPPAQAWSGATLKAIAIDTCDDAGIEGPDYRMGYGIFNARSAALAVNAEAANGRGSLIKELTLAPTVSMSWVVASTAAQPLAITAAWSDPPGPALVTPTAADPQNAMLVNNLDLRVDYLGPHAGTYPPPPLPVTTHLPWLLNPDLTNRTAAVRGAAATRGVDNRNNVEKVSLTAPAAGLYRITLTHSGGLAGNPAPSTQPVSLVVSGATSVKPEITNVVKSGSNQFLLHFDADPGAYFTVETSTDLNNWSSIGSVLATNVANSTLVTANGSEDKRFWRLRRGQQ